MCLAVSPIALETLNLMLGTGSSASLRRQGAIMLLLNSLEHSACILLMKKTAWIRIINFSFLPNSSIFSVKMSCSHYLSKWTLLSLMRLLVTSSLIAKTLSWSIFTITSCSLAMNTYLSIKPTRVTMNSTTAKRMRQILSEQRVVKVGINLS